MVSGTCHTVYHIVCKFWTVWECTDPPNADWRGWNLVDGEKYRHSGSTRIRQNLIDMSCFHYIPSLMRPRQCSKAMSLDAGLLANVWFFFSLSFFFIKACHDHIGINYTREAKRGFSDFEEKYKRVAHVFFKTHETSWLGLALTLSKFHPVSMELKNFVWNKIAEGPPPATWITALGPGLFFCLAWNMHLS